MYENNFQELPPKPFALRNYLQTLQRRKEIVLLCLAVAVIVVVLFNQLSAPVYEAVATILYEEPKSEVLISEMGRPAITRNELINLVERIKSRGLAEELARALPKSIIESLGVSAQTAGNLSQEEFIVPALQKNLSVKIVPGTDILEIKVTANDPHVAKIIADTYVKRIIDWNLQKRRNEISSTLEFVGKQLTVFQNKLGAAEEALRAFKEKNKMITLDNASTEMLARIAEVEANYNTTQTERLALEQRQRMVELRLAPSRAVGSNLRVQQLKKRLLELETQRSSLRAQGVAPNQPKILSIQQEISRVKEALIQQLLNANPREGLLSRNLLQESVDLEANLATYTVKEQALQNLIAGYNKEIQALPQQELKLARLARDREVNDKIYSMLLGKREELRIAEAGKFGEVQLMDAAQAPIAPVKPQKAKNLALGLFLGLSLGIGLVVLLESLDTSLKSPKDVEEQVNLPVLAVIPSIHLNDKMNGKMHSLKSDREAVRSYAGRLLSLNGKMRSLKSDREAVRCYAGRLLSQLEAGSHVYEAYRALQIKFAMVNGSPVLKSILVTSPNAAEGKTLTAINMAHAFARTGIKTLLVDCDLRRPMIHHILGINQEPGLSDILRNHIVVIEKAAIKWAIQAPENENLFVFPCGTLPPNPYELLDTQRMRDVLAEFKRQYDVVILDSPPLMAVTDSIVLGSEVDGVCLVIKSGRTRQEAALRAKNLLENSQTNIIGTILNDIDTKTVNGYETSHHYIS